MMKKRILTLIVAICMILSITPISVSAAEDSKKVAMYEAYCDFITERVRYSGYLAPSSIKTIPYTSGHDVNILDPQTCGIIFTKLIDFDLDGKDELFVLESDFRESSFSSNACDVVWKVYTYQNGSVIEMISNKVRYGYFGFVKDAAGKTSFYNAQGQDNWEDYNTFSLVNGKWSETYVTHNWNYDWSVSGVVNGHHVHIHSDTLHGDGSALVITDEEAVYADDKKVRELRAELTAGGSEIYDYNSMPPDNTPQNLMQQLEQTYFPNSRTPSGWAETFVSQCIAAGYVPKELQKRYQTPITRVEFCALVTKYYESVTRQTITQTSTFTDTTDINVQKMAGLGIVGGIGGGKFAPEDLLTREQAATLLTNLASSLNYSLPDSAPTFADNDKISSWAYNQVGKIQAAEIMSGIGDNKFDPLSSYTREQCIITILKMDSIRPKVSSITFEEKQVEIPMHFVKKISPIIEAEDTADIKLVWSSSSPEIVDINEQTGYFSAKAAGTATITATAPSGVSGSIKIKVLPEQFMYAATPISIDCLGVPQMRKGSIDSLSSDFNYEPPASAFELGTYKIESVEANCTTDFFGEYETDLTITGTFNYAKNISAETLDWPFDSYIKYQILGVGGYKVYSGFLSHSYLLHRNIENLPGTSETVTYKDTIYSFDAKLNPDEHYEIVFYGR